MAKYNLTKHFYHPKQQKPQVADNEPFIEFTPDDIKGMYAELMNSEPVNQLDPISNLPAHGMSRNQRRAFEQAKLKKDAE